MYRFAVFLPACSVEVQLVGDRKNTRVDQRILHLDVAAAALKLVRPLHLVVYLEPALHFMLAS